MNPRAFLTLASLVLPLVFVINAANAAGDIGAYRTLADEGEHTSAVWFFGSWAVIALLWWYSNVEEKKMRAEWLAKEPERAAAKKRAAVVIKEREAQEEEKQKRKYTELCKRYGNNWQMDYIIAINSEEEVDIKPPKPDSWTLN